MGLVRLLGLASLATGLGIGMTPSLPARHLRAPVNTAKTLGAPQERRAFTLQFKDSEVYGTARDVELKTVTLRRAMKSFPKERIEYAKVELWLSNLDIDVCSMPELGDVSSASLPLRAPEDFVLVWQGVGNAKPGTPLAQTPVAQAFFSDQWPEKYGKPVVVWWGGYIAQGEEVLRQLFKDEPIAVEGPWWDKGPSLWIIPKGQLKGRGPRGREEELGFTSVKALGAVGAWIVYHAGPRNPRLRETRFMYAIARKGDNAPVLGFSSWSRANIQADGQVQVTRICPGVIDEKRFWLNEKIYPR